MEENKRFLIAIDLDDTVLSSLFSLCARSVEALIDAKQAGHRVMIATARPTAMALPYYRLLGLDTPLSVLNGARMHHPGDPSFPEENHRLSEAETAGVLRALSAVGAEDVWLENDDELWARGTALCDHRYFSEVMRNSRTHLCDTLPALASCRVFARVPAAEAVERVRADMAVYPGVQIGVFGGKGGAPFQMSFSSVRADKWFTVQKAAAYYGIRPENIVAFGDGENDRQMVLNAARGYAMCNGSPALQRDALAAGRRVTEKSCAEGGVALEIAALLAGHAGE